MVGASENSEEESDNQWVPPRLSSLSGYTDSELERGSIVEFWWPTKKFVGVITRRPTADEPIDQITGHHRNQATILHRPSAYVIEFEDREVHILCFPNDGAALWRRQQGQQQARCQRLGPAFRAAA